MAGSQKQKFLALLKILYEQTDENHPLSAPQLIELLADEGISCERKAIYRDVESLCSFGFDIMQSTCPPGYFWGSRLFETPELRMLVDSIKSSEFITEKKTGEMIEKLKHLTSRYQAEELDSIKDIAGRPKNRNEGIFYTIDSLHFAILNKRKVKFSYYRHVVRDGRILSQKSHEFTVSPYALIWDDGKYYLVANYGKYDNFSHYRLDRMRQVEVLLEPSRPLNQFSHYDQVFDENDYISGVFGMYAGNYEDFVYLRCNMDSLEHLVDRFGHDIICEAYDESYFTVRIRAVINDGLVSWILAQRGRVSVMYPPELAEKVRLTLGGMMAQYDALN